jgi:DNA-binding NarL/FixJ family response regulator
MSDPAQPVIRVAIADDQPLVRAGFRMILDSEPDIEIVAEAADGRELLELAARVRPDVILMDIRMPHVDGIQAARRLIAEAGERAPRVLMLTTFDVDEHVYDALRAGASGFLLKDVQPDDLVAAVRIVASGEALLAPSVTRRLIADFARRRTRAGRADEVLGELTAREREVVGLVASGLSNEDIAHRIYVSQSTVKTHVARSMAKLGARDRAQLVVAAYESGLVHPGWADQA